MGHNMKQVVEKEDLPKVMNIYTTPTPTGNTVGLGQVAKDPIGDVYYIDRDGVSAKLNGTSPSLMNISWTTPTLLNGFKNYGSIYRNLQYRVINDVLYIYGLVKGGGTNKVLFTLPANIAARINKTVPQGVDRAASANGRIDIMADGNVLVRNYSSAWTSVDLVRPLD
jgi:hypothetical protein